MAHLLHKTGAIRVESLGMPGKTELNHSQACTTCTGKPRAQSLPFRPHDADDKCLQHWDFDCNRAGVLTQCTSCERWRHAHHNKLCFTLKTCYGYSFIVTGNREVLIHDCSPYVRQFWRGDCKQVRSVTNLMVHSLAFATYQSCYE